ncbi:MAG: ABC transporter permease subunit [bacterium]|nr:ABC transporter permease subunit [bacterium]
MGRVIVREFLKALPRRTLLWIVTLWFVFLVWILVFQAGNYYTHMLESASRAFNLTSAERLREFIELAPPQHPVKGMALLLSPRLAPSHGLALLTSTAAIIMVILASRLFGDEYGFGTIRRLWTEGPPRVVHLAGKVGGICLVILAAMAFTCLAAVLLTPVVRWFYPIPWLPGAEFPPLGQLARRVAVQLPVSMAIVLFMALFAGAVAAAARSALAGAIAVPSVHSVLPRLCPARVAAAAFPRMACTCFAGPGVPGVRPRTASARHGADGERHQYHDGREGAPRHGHL